jgi:hypothetical protein
VLLKCQLEKEGNYFPRSVDPPAALNSFLSLPQYPGHTVIFSINQLLQPL